MKVKSGATIEGIIHAAAFTLVDAAEQRPEDAFIGNVIATRNIARWAAMQGLPLVYVSTSSVFDGEQGNYSPSAVPYPRNYYSWTKLLGEEAILAHGGCVVRLTVIGVHPERRPPANFLEWLSESLVARRAVTLYEDARINPLSPGTAAEVLLAILEHAPASTIWHAGTRDVISKAEIGRYWQQQHFKGAEICISIARLDAQFGSVPRGRELWLDVSATQHIYPMPLSEAELFRCSRENPPWT
jgi:dTDP-4-dehydrorhamnose reductase